MLAANITKFSQSIEVEEIDYSRTVTYLNIIILDQNDNSPVFTNPAYTGYQVGFPEQELAKKLMPVNLMIVEAYDDDEGLNADITFGISSNGHFAIDEEFGVVYPLKDCMKDVETIEITVGSC